MASTPHWEALAPFDALSWALCLRNRKAARALLDRREALPWTEASEYAPLTLGWAPELLERILDLAPPEELYCVRALWRPGGGWTVEVYASLLTAAAALDDVEAVRLLLARGYAAGNFEVTRYIRLSPRFKELGRIRSNAKIYTLDTVLFHPGAPGQRPLKYHYYHYLDYADPLAAAILCGARRCAMLLLGERAGELSLSCRHVLSWDCLPGDPRFLPTVRAVTSILGAGLAELLEPGDFQDRNNPLFLDSIRAHCEDPTCLSLYGYMLTCLRDTLWAWAGVALLPPRVLSAALMEQISPQAKHRNQQLTRKDIQLLADHPRVHLAIDRNTVPADVDQRLLLYCLDRARITGRPPEGCLSGLARVLLPVMLGQASDQKCRVQSGVLWQNRQVLAALHQEDPALVSAFLEQTRQDPGSRYPDTAYHLVRALLGLPRKEEHVYEF